MTYHFHSRSAVRTLLKALIPYTRENLLLSYKPNQFFNELERSSGYSRKTLRNAANRASQKGLLRYEDGIPLLTNKGLHAMQPYIATKLAKQARLMVTFDIPEENSHLRRQLRQLLREWHFEQVQKSVWISQYDYGSVLVEAIEELGLGECVQVFECARLYPKD